MKLLLLLALILCGCRTPDPFPIETKADKDFEAGRITADEWARLTGVDESVDTIIRLQGDIWTNAFGTNGIGPLAPAPSLPPAGDKP